MLGQRNPNAVYRSIEFDARAVSATPHDSVKMCYEQLVGALGRSLLGAQKGDNRLKSEGLTRAVAALTALQMGVRGEGSMPDALHQLYVTARRAVLDSAVSFDAATIEQIRKDFVDISAALTG